MSKIKNFEYYIDKLIKVRDLLDRIKPEFKDDHEYFNTPNYVPNRQDLNLIEEFFNLNKNELVKRHLDDVMAVVDKEVEFYVSRGVNPKDLVLLLSYNDADMFPGMTEEILVKAGKLKVRKVRTRDHDKSSVRSIEDCKRFEMCDLKGLE